MASRRGPGSSSVSLRWDSKRIEALAEKAIEAGLTEAGKHGRAAVKAELAGSSGSSPGSAPGSVSGALRRSVAYKRKKRKGKYVLVVVGVLRPSTWDSKAEGKSFPGRMHAQAVRLERGFVGTDRLGRMYEQAPRPFTRTVLKRERDRMGQIVFETAKKWMPTPKEAR